MSLRPFIAWLVLAAAVVGVLIRDGIILYSIIAVAIGLYIVAATARRQVLLLVPFIAAGVLASLFTLPLPESWPGLVRLALTLMVWLAAGIGLTAGTMVALGRDVESNYAGDGDKE